MNDDRILCVHKMTDHFSTKRGATGKTNVPVGVGYFGRRAALQHAIGFVSCKESMLNISVNQYGVVDATSMMMM